MGTSVLNICWVFLCGVCEFLVFVCFVLFLGGCGYLEMT